MLTDYALAAMASALGVSLFRASRINRQVSVRLWGAAFIATAGATIAGGTSHGFAVVLSEATKASLWKATVYSTGLVSLSMLSGTIVASLAGLLRRYLLGATGVKFLVYAVWMATHDDFRYVIYDYTTAMLAVLILHAYVWREESAKWIIAGVLVSFAAAGIQQSGFSLHHNFNHNDLYHVIQIGAVYLFYKGARVLKDR